MSSPRSIVKHYRINKKNYYPTKKCQHPRYNGSCDGDENCKCASSAIIDLPPQRPPNYGIMAQELYLGMIENSQKVKKDKRNVEYVASMYSLDYQAESNNKRKYESDEEIEDEEEQEQEQEPKKIRYDDEHMKRIKELEQSIVPSTENKPVIYQQPPSLATIRDQVAQKENTVDEEKQEYIAKFSMAAKMYPSAQIPYITMSTDLQFMKNEYNTLMRKLNIDDKHQKYKQFLTMAFYGIEFVLGKFFKLKMVGFAEEQIKNMEKYDRLLLELGHKHYIPNAPERFPVEIRLVGLLLIQTAFFLIMQKISNNMSIGGSGGNGLFSFFSNMMSGGMTSGKSASVASASVASATSEPAKSRMSGPKMDDVNKNGPIEEKAAAQAA